MDLNGFADLATTFAPIDDMNPTCRHEMPIRSYAREIERVASLIIGSELA
jgi:hypothetical protein